MYVIKAHAFIDQEAVHVPMVTRFLFCDFISFFNDLNTLRNVEKTLFKETHTYTSVVFNSVGVKYAQTCAYNPTKRTPKLVFDDKLFNELRTSVTCTCAFFFVYYIM